MDRLSGTWPNFFTIKAKTQLHNSVSRSVRARSNSGGADLEKGLPCLLPIGGKPCFCRNFVLCDMPCVLSGWCVLAFFGAGRPSGSSCTNSSKLNAVSGCDLTFESRPWNASKGWAWSRTRSRRIITMNTRRRRMGKPACRASKVKCVMAYSGRNSKPCLIFRVPCRLTPRRM